MTFHDLSRFLLNLWFSHCFTLKFGKISRYRVHRATRVLYLRSGIDDQNLTRRCRIDAGKEVDTWFRYGYGSIPINTIFRGMNIHLPAILMFTRGTRFWPITILEHPEANLQTCHQASAFDDQDRWRLSQSLQLLTLRCGEVVWKKTWLISAGKLTLT